MQAATWRGLRLGRALGCDTETRRIRTMMNKELTLTKYGWSYTRGVLNSDHPDFPMLTPREEDSNGFLSFLGSGLRRGSRFGNPCVAGIEFWAGETDDRADDYELWANDIRSKILVGLSADPGLSWYISVYGDRFGEHGLWPDAHGVLAGTADVLGLGVCNVGAWVPMGQTTYRKPFAEVPRGQLQAFVDSCWKDAYAGYPIEGYCMQSQSIDTLQRWDARERDEALFKDVLDSCQCMFYTTPAENRDFTFISNKLQYADFSRLIDDLRNNGTLDGVRLRFFPRP